MGDRVTIWDEDTAVWKLSSLPWFFYGRYCIRDSVGLHRPQQLVSFIIFLFFIFLKILNDQAPESDINRHSCQAVQPIGNHIITSYVHSLDRYLLNSVWHVWWCCQKKIYVDIQGTYDCLRSSTCPCFPGSRYLTVIRGMVGWGVRINGVVMLVYL